jgi:hypothetical protein
MFDFLRKKKPANEETPKPLSSQTQDSLNEQLAVACKSGDTEHALYLLDQGAEASNVWWEISRENRLEIAKGFIDKGVDINASGVFGRPILLVASYGTPQMFDLLVAHGADINARTYYEGTLLHIAMKDNNALMVEKLLREGFDPEAVNDKGQTPAAYARAGDNEKAEGIIAFLENLVRTKSYIAQPGWHKTGEREISLVEEKSEIGLRFTHVFNFEAGTHTHLATDLSTHVPGTPETHAISVCPDKALLEKARAESRSRGVLLQSPLKL